MTRMLLAILLAGLSGVAAADLAAPIATTNYFPLVDGARYEYVFRRGPHASATAVMHGRQTWGGAYALTGFHMRYACADATPCNHDSTAFYGTTPDGLRYFGGDSATPGNVHFMTTLDSPEWLLKNPVSPGVLVPLELEYRNAETWSATVVGSDSLLGPQSYVSSYQALALEPVVTPAGTFARALHVRETRGSGYERDIWYAPNVGIVRWVDAYEEAVLASVVWPTAPVPTVVFAVEYYHPALDHYFTTADIEEIDALDAGRFTGWLRTGRGFNVTTPSGTGDAAAVPVCRYYGSPTYGLDTHFYSASEAECQAVTWYWPQQWVLESSNVFRVALPDPTTGGCPDWTIPVYRSWNNRLDSNHRYTVESSVQAMMVDQGNIAEGYGDPVVAMCSPL